MAHPNPGDEYSSGAPYWVSGCLYTRSQLMSAKVSPLQLIRSPWEGPHLITQSQLETQFLTCQRLIGGLECQAKIVKLNANKNMGYRQLACQRIRQPQLETTVLCTPINPLQNFSEKYAVMRRERLSRTTLLANGTTRQCCDSPGSQ